MAGGKMNPRLIICIICSSLWILETAVFIALISAKKSSMKKNGEPVPKPDSKLIPSCLISLAVIILPYLVYFQQIFVTLILEGCGVLGTFIVLKERLDQLRGER